jgi:hypothetical protein
MTSQTPLYGQGILSRNNGSFPTYNPGDICWLKPKDEASKNGTSYIPDGCFNHPVVILWIDEGPKTVTIFTVCVNVSARYM